MFESTRRTLGRSLKSVIQSSRN